MENEDNLKLVYVKKVGKNTDGTFVYDFFFSETPEYVWGPLWDVDNPSSNGNINPDSTTYSVVKQVVTDLPIKTAEETTCYSMEYATYGILALCYLDIEDLPSYPEHGRITMHFGDSFYSVEDKLNLYGWKFK